MRLNILFISFVKQVHDMTLEIRFNSFILAIVSILLLLSLLLYSFQTISINAQYSNNNNKGNNDVDTDLTTIKTKINLNNIDVENHNRLKIVGYLNGEGQTFYVDLKEHKDKTKINDDSLTVNLKFNKSNDISQVMFDDEYYVCGYLLDNDDDDGEPNTNTAAITTKSNLPLYDCDEGNIGLTSTDKDSVKLFYTLKKFNESNAIYKTTTNNNLLSTKENPNEVKLRINVPIYDNKKINDMYIVAMVKGEYQIKEIDVQNELEKKDKKSSNERLLIPFTFGRNTEVGPIEPGDMFFGCATSDEFPNQNSDCEKKVIKDLYKIDQLCARKDSFC